MKFMHSETFANIIPTSNWSYPVVDIPLHESFSGLHKPKSMILMDGKVVQEKRKVIINEYFKAIEK